MPFSVLGAVDEKSEFGFGVAIEICEIMFNASN